MYQKDDGLIHIYYDKYYGIRRNTSLKLLCNPGKNVPAKKHHPRTEMCAVGWEIKGIRQVSVGAGHGSNCDDCILAYAKRISKNHNIVMNKVLDIVERQEAELKELRELSCFIAKSKVV